MKTNKNTVRTQPFHWLLSVLLMIAVSWGLRGSLLAAPAVVEEYFIPFDEDDILTASQHAYTEFAPLNCGLRGNTLSDPINPIRGFVSFVVGEDGTEIVFDHWEDGYEAIPNVKTQSSTIIWGDGNLTNGVAPGHADDLLDRGDVVTINNNVVSTTRASVIDFDGGDRFVSSGALAVTRSGWATQSETLMAGATEVYPTVAWGSNFKLPVGENFVMAGNSLTDNRFEYTAATIQAARDNTQVQIDADANGSFETTVTINRGQSHFVNGGLLQNARIVSDNPVSVVLYTADKCATYEADWFYLPHLDQYSDTYLGPVGTPTTGTTQIHIHNPNTTAITVNWATAGPVAQAPLTIPANSGVSVTSPNTSGQRFKSTGGEPFIALGTISSNQTGGPSGSPNATSVWDWGYTLVPSVLVSNQIISTGWSPGRDPNSALNPTANVSPIWVTADHPNNPTSTATVEICVDYNNNGGSLVDSNGVSYDQKFIAVPLDSVIIYDPDGDQTGMRLWVCDGSDAVIAAAWGEDPNTAPTGSPSLDLGTTVLNGVPFSAGKNVELLIDVNGNGLYDVGDTVRYTVIVRNAGALPLAANSMHVSDVFPPDLTYVTSSTNGKLGTGALVPVPDSGSGSAFPLDNGGVYVPVSIPPFGEYTYTFEGFIPAYPTGGSIVNDASVDDGTTFRNPSVTFIVQNTATIGNFVWRDLDLDGIQDGGAETGIVGVTVTLKDASGNDIDSNPSLAGVQPTTTTTNASGFYSFTVTPGSYIVHVASPVGYSVSPANQGGDDLLDSDISPTTNRTGLITVAAGAVDNSNDAGLTQPSSISGRVLADNNNDNTGDVGISGATVSLFSDPNGDGDPSDGAQVGSPATTNGTGDYSFTNLPPGNYVVVETQPVGYLNVTDLDSTTPGDDVANSSTSDNRIPVGLTTNENDTGNDFVEELPGTISGSVFADTNNDNTGDTAISGVTVTLFTDPNGDGDPADGSQVGSPATTIANGSYTFSNLAPGNYVVVETQPAGYLTVTDLDSTTPADDVANSSTTDNRIPVGIAAGETDTGNDFIEEAPGSITGSVLADTNNDGSGDVGISGVTLTLVDSAGNPVDGDPNTAGVQPITTTTAGNGSYSFTNIPPGTYGVLETQPAGYLSVSDKDGGNLNEIRPISVPAGGTNTLNDFVEESPGTISGSVLADTNNDDEGDVGISGATVTLFTDPNGDGDPADGTQVGSPTTTNGGGGYSFTNLAPGNYVVVEMQPSGYLTVGDDDSTGGGDDVANASQTDNRIPVGLTAGETDTGNDFVEEQPGTISGSVLADTNNDNNGDAGIAGATVTLFTDPNGDGNPADGAPVGSPATTPANGSYQFTNLPPGNYVVVETQPAGYLNVRDVDSTTPADDTANANTTDDRIPVTIAANESDTGNDFIEELPGVISGFVYDDTNNDNTGDAGIPNVALTLVDASGAPVDGDPITAGVQPITTTTAPNGSYTFTNLPPGTYGVLETQPSGYLNVNDIDGGDPSEIRPIVLNAGATSSGNNFVEELPGSISGTVFADTNNDNVGDAGIPSVTITLFTDPNGDGNPADGLPVGSPATTGANGSYSFSNVAPGNYVVVETQPAGYNTVTDVDSTTPGDDVANASITDNRIPVGLNPGESDTGNDFIEEQPGSISGSVLADTNNDDSGDNGIGGVTLTLVDSAGNPVDGDPNTAGVQPITTTSQPNGTYTFTNVPPGTYGVVETQPAGYLDVTDSDGGNPSEIRPIVVTAGAQNNGNDFIEELPATISGSVLADSDNNNSGDSGIAGVTLTLFTDPNGDGDPADGAQVGSPTTTLPDGSYLFSNVPPGKYVVVETQPAPYLSVTDGDVTTPADDLANASTTDNRIPVGVTAGESDTGNDFIEELPGTITGIVLADTDNNNTGDTPILGVTLTLADASGNPIDSDPNTPGVQPITTTTAVDGTYTFTTVPPGTYSVIETQPAGFLDVSDSDGGPPSIVQTVNVTAGNTTPGVNFVEEEPGIITGTLLADTNNDNVGDQPIPGVTLTLVDPSGDPVDGDPNTPGVQPITAVTQPDGTYTFIVPPGTYGVVETQPDGFFSVSDVDGGNPDQIQLITVVAGGTTPGQDFLEEEPGIIAGRVLSDVDGDGDGDTTLPGVVITLYTDPNGDGDPTDGVIVGTPIMTNGSGAYTFPDLEPGNYVVIETQPTGYLTVSDADSTIDEAGSPVDPANTSGTDNRIAVIVQAGETDNGNDFIESVPATLGDFVFQDLNRNGVQDPGEPGIEGIVVTLRDGTGAVLSSTTTNGLGRYEFANLNPGEYSISVPTSLDNGDLLSPANVGSDVLDSEPNPATGISGTFTLVPAQNETGVDVGYFSPKGSIGSLVWKDLNRDGVQQIGEPGIENVPVTLFNSSGVAIGITSTDALGYYNFRDLDPGTYSVGVPPTLVDGCTITTPNLGGNDELDSDGDATTGKTPSFVLGVGENKADVDFGFINPKARIGDYVWMDLNRNFQQDAGEPGIEGVTVVLYNSTGVAVGTTTTNGSGFYQFTNLDPGTYSVGFQTTLPDGAVLTASVQGPPATDSNPDTSTGRTAAFTLAIAENNTSIDAGYVSPFASIGQYVWRDLDRDGRQDEGEPGIENVQVNLYNNLGTLVGTTTTDSLGFFHFTELQPGTYSVGFPTVLVNQDVLTTPDLVADNLDSDPSITTGRTPTVVLSAGQNYVDYGAGYVSPLGSIGDYVWTDLDEDGVQDPGEPGIQGAIVTLLNSSGVAIGSTTTNATGYYVFADLQPGTYAVKFPATLQAGTSVLSPIDQGGDDATDSDANATTGITANITLTSGQNISNIDAGYIPNFGSIGDRVWADNDRDGVQDPDEPGIQGVTVTLLNGAGDPIGTSTTDSYGYYHFTNLQPGTYAVKFPVSLPTGTILSNANQGGNPATDSDPVALTGITPPITVTASSNIVTVDAGYFAPQATLGDFVWKDLNRNGVQDGGEPGIQGVTVTLLNSAGTPVGTTTTDAIGFYSFTNIAPGEYSVEFPTSLGAGLVLVSADQGAEGVDSDANSTTGRTIQTTLAQGENDLSWDAGYLSPLGSLGDFVWDDRDQDGVQDPGEPGIAGVNVILLDDNGDPIGTTTTDSTGHFAFTDLAPGDYALQFPATLPSGGVLSPTGNGAPGTDTDPTPSTGITPTITLGSGENKTDLDAGYFSPLASVGDFVWKDLNRNGAQDPGEPGIAGVTVTLLNSTGTPIGTKATDSTGYFSFDNLQAGTYALSFPVALVDGCVVTPVDQAGGDDALDSDANVTTGVTPNFTLANAEHKSDVDAGYASMKGSIGDYVWRDLDRNGVQDPGEPGIQGVVVTLLDNSGTPIGTTTTDSTGHFNFVDLDPGVYSVSFPTSLGGGLVLSTPDQGTDVADTDPAINTGVTAPVSLAPGQHIDSVDAGYNSPFGSISNFVWNDADRNGVQDSGEPGIENVVVTLLNGAGTPIGSTITDATGSYSFIDLQPGTYSLQFPVSLSSGNFVLTTANQGTDALDSDPIKSTGRTANIILVAGQNDNTWDAGYVSPQGSIGDFVFQDLNRNGIQEIGEPGIAGVIVSLLDSAGDAIGVTITDGTGKYLFAGLEPGTYAVEFPTTLPDNSVLTTPTQGVNPALDSDANITTGRTASVTLSEGQIVTNLDGGYSSPLASIGNFVWMDVDRDGIQDSGEPGLAGVPVTLYNSSGVSIGTDVTDGQGFYTFTNLQPGDYVVGFPTTYGGYILTSPGLGTVASDSNPVVSTGRTSVIALAPGETNTSIDAGFFSPLASVGDFVWLDLNRDGIQQSGEPGVADVSVTLYNSIGLPIGTTVTNGDGYYLFSDLQPGDYSVGFPTSIVPGYVLSQADQGGNDTTDSDANPTNGMSPSFSLLAGINNLDVDAAYTSPFASLGNFVWHDLNRDGLQQPGEPGIANVTVTLYNAAGVAIGSDLTDATGYYSFTNLQPGEYYIGVSTTLPDGLSLTLANAGNDALDSDVSPITGRSTLVTLAAGENNSSLDAAYTTPFGNVGDRVWRDIDRDGVQDPGEPGISNVRVTLYDSTGVAIGTDVTNGLGYYGFFDLLPGTYSIGFPTELGDGAQLGLQNQGGDDAKDSDPEPATGRTTTFVLAAGQSVSTLDAGYINPPLSIGSSIWLDQDHDGVQDLGEPGIPSAKVELFFANQQPARDFEGTLVPLQTTGTNGEYLFANLAPGDYIVRVTPTAGLKPTNGGVDPDNDNNKDSNGLEMLGEVYVQSLPVTISSNAEPVTDGDVDPNTNLSVDFGFYYPKYDLALRKSLPSNQPNPIKAGSKVTFAIELFNQGDIPVNNITLIDYTPAGLVLDPALSPNWTALPNGNATGLIVNPVQPGSSHTVTVTYTVALTAEGQALHNYAEITGARDPDGAQITDVDSTPDNIPGNDGLVSNDELYNNNGDEDDHDGSTINIMPPGVWDLALRKSLGLNQAQSVNPGDNVLFNVEVFNQGTETAYSVRVVDYIPANMSLNDLRWSAGTGNTASTLLNQPLQGGTSVILPIILKVNTNVVGPVDITNFAEVQSFVDEHGNVRADTDSTPDNIATNDGPSTDDALNNENSDQDDHDGSTFHVNAPAVFDLALRKKLAEGQSHSVPRNGLITFEFEVFNQGSIAAQNVIITDYLASSLIIEDENWFSTLPGQVATTVYGPINPGESVRITLTTRLSNTATANAVITNRAEISAAYTLIGQPATDSDSPMDNNPSNDGVPTNDAINNENGDKDNSDFATISVQPPGIFDLAMRKTLALGQATSVNAGDYVNFVVEIFNQGSVPAKAIQVTEYIPAGTTLADSNWIDNGNGTATGSFGSVYTLAPGASAQMPIRLRVNTTTAAGIIRNIAEISSARDGDGNLIADNDSMMDSNGSNDGFMTDDELNGTNFDEDDSDFAAFTVNEPGRVDLALRKSLKTGQVASVRPGNKVTYKMEVFNQGMLPATNVKVVDYLPLGLTFSPADNSGWTEILTGMIEFTISGPIQAGGSATVELTLTVAASASPNTSVTNRAEVSSFEATGPNGVIITVDADSTPDTNSANDGQSVNDAINNENLDQDDFDIETINILEPEKVDLSLIKRLRDGQSNTPAPGQRVYYDIIVSNDCGQPVHDIKVNDYVPAGLQLAPECVDQWTVEGNGTISQTIPGPIESGETGIIAVTFIVAENAIPGTIIRNCAEVAGAKDALGNVATDHDSIFNNNHGDNGDCCGPVENDEDDNDCVSITVGQPDRIDLALRNTLAPGQSAKVNPGDLVTLAIEVFNQGSLPVNDVTVINCLPAGFTIEDPNWTPVVGGGYGRTIPGLIPVGYSVVMHITMRAGETAGELRNSAEIVSARNGEGVLVNPATGDVDSVYDTDCTNDGIIVDNELNNALGDEDDSDIQLITVEQSGVIGNYMWFDANNNGMKDTNEMGINGVVVQLCDASGNAIDADSVLAGVQPMTTTTGDNPATVGVVETGWYQFTGLPAGSYIVKIATPPANYPASSTVTDIADNGEDDDDNGIQTTIGGTITSPIIVLVSGEMECNVDFGLLDPKPKNFDDWVTLNGLTGPNAAPTANPDGDKYDNLQEFAFCMNPTSGINIKCPLTLEITQAGLINAKLVVVTGLTGLTYNLEYISDLALSTANGGGWTPVETIFPTAVNNPDGTTTLTYANLESLPGLNLGRGFVRVKLDLASPAVTSRTHADGWSDRFIAPTCDSYSNAFLKCEVFGGSVDSNTTSVINITTAVGTGNFATSLVPGRSYYVEVATGPLAGHRWNVIAGSTATGIAVGTGTKALAANALTGASIYVREALTFGELFPPALYKAGNTPTNSDNILVYDHFSVNKWTTYYLADLTAGNLGIHWIKQGDSSATIQDNVALDACQGIFFHHRAVGFTITQIGHIRQNPLACPLIPGRTLVGAGYPVDQSPADRAMVWTGSNFNGFDGDIDAVLSDTLLFWRGDDTIGADNYTTYWLVDAGFNPYRRWAVQGDNALNSKDSIKLFKVNRSAFYVNKLGNPDWVMPTGWVP